MTHCLREGGDPQRRARRRGFQYNAAEQATWGPVIKLMDDPLRIGAGRQPAKDGFSTRSGLCRLSRNKKMSGYPRDRVASCALARCPVSAPRRCHEVVPWQTVAAFERPLWRNVAVRSGSTASIRFLQDRPFRNHPVRAARVTEVADLPPPNSGVGFDL